MHYALRNQNVQNLVGVSAEGFICGRMLSQFFTFFSGVAKIKGHLFCFLELLAKYVMGIVGAQPKNILSIFIYAFVLTFLFPKRDHV